MAHELTARSNNFVEHAYVGDKPWHGLGQQLDEGASIEQWRVAAGMDWRIQRSRVRYASEVGAVHTWDDQHVLFRSDSKLPLGLVSSAYKVVQPAQVLEFFRDLVSDAGFSLHTAGTLFGGRRFWALARIDDAIISGWDKVGGYLLLSTSADGSSATDVRETTVRVVCNNTLSCALGTKSAKRARVSHRSVFDAAAIKHSLGLSREHFTAFIEAANALSKVRTTRRDAENFVASLLRSSAVDKTVADRAAPGEAKILSLFSGEGKGALLAGANGTAWGLVNAVTEYVVHHARAKTADHRLSNALFGDGDATKSAALTLAVERFL